MKPKKLKNYFQIIWKNINTFNKNIYNEII